MFRDMDDERRLRYVNFVLDYLLGALSPRERAIIRKNIPSFYEDEDGKEFERYVTVLHLLPYLSKQDISLEKKCEVSKKVSEVLEQSGVKVSNLKYFIENYCH